MIDSLAYWPVAVGAIALFALRDMLTGRWRGAPMLFGSASRHYALVGQITNNSESRFFRSLQSHVPRGMLILIKPRLEDVIEVSRTAKRRHRALRGRVKSRHLDFLIVDARLRPIAAIELDGPSHRRRQTRRTDRFKSRLAASVGLPLYRVPVGMDYDAASRYIFGQLR
ncbi:MAG: DUF2726 domain-containing protein [Litorimonas sp.]